MASSRMHVRRSSLYHKKVKENEDARMHGAAIGNQFPGVIVVRIEAKVS